MVTLSLRIVREQEGIPVTGAGQRLDMCPNGLAKRHRARAGLGVGQVDGVAVDVAAAFFQGSRATGQDGASSKAL